MRVPKNAIADIHGTPSQCKTVVASEEPPSLASVLEPVRELLAHIEDLASEFSICREILQSSYVLAVRSALAVQGVAA
jgi:hypothetical protein